MVCLGEQVDLMHELVGGRGDECGGAAVLAVGAQCDEGLVGLCKVARRP